MKYNSKSNPPVYYNIQKITITNTYPNEELLEVILFQCECVISMIDILDRESFNIIINLNNKINNLSFPDLTKIFVANKNDLESETAVSDFEIKQYIDSNKDIQLFEISLSSMQHVSGLFEKIRTIYDITKLIPNKYIKESFDQKQISSNYAQGSLKIVILGNSFVGKTSFYGRYFTNNFSQEFISTIGIAKQSKIMKIFKEIYSIQLWDTAGQEKYRSIPPKYYTNADGILLLYDIGNRKSFNDIVGWLKDIQCNLSKNDNNTWLNSMTLYLIGNKVDLQSRAVEYKEAVEFAMKNNIEYYEVSCKWNLNINEVIYNMVFTTYKKINKQPDSQKLIKLKSAAKTEVSKMKCCF